MTVPEVLLEASLVPRPVRPHLDALPVTLVVGELARVAEARGPAECASTTSRLAVPPSAASIHGAAFELNRHIQRLHVATAGRGGAEKGRHN